MTEFPIERRNLLRMTGAIGAAGVVQTNGEGSTSEGDKIWEFNTIDRVWAGPTVVEETLFIGTHGFSNRDGKIHAIDTQTGDELWHIETNGRVNYPVIVVDGIAFFDDTDNHIRAVDADTGSDLWQSNLIFPRGAPVIYENKALCASLSGVYALDAGTGEVLWQAVSDDQMETTLAVKDDTAYGVNFQGDIIALDAENGEQQWRTEMSRYTQTQGVETTVADGTVFHGDLGDTDNTRNGTLFALNAASGEIEWTFETESRVVSTPTVADSLVLFGSDNTLYAVDVDNGEEVWHFKDKTSARNVGGSPTVADGIVFFGWDEGVSAVDITDGTEQWRFETFDVSSAPIISDGTVFFGSGDLDGNGAVYAVDTGVGGLSEGSRALSGVNGHHDNWLHTGQSIEPSPPALPGFENAPQDINGDGLYEDIDGDGEFDIFDVQALFEGLNSDPVQSNPAAFNFNDDEDPEEEGVTIFDVQGLFNRL